MKILNGLRCINGQCGARTHDRCIKSWTLYTALYRLKLELAGRQTGPSSLAARMITWYLLIYLHSQDLAIRCLNFFFLNSQSPSLLHSATITVCGFVFFVTLLVFTIWTVQVPGEAGHGQQRGADVKYWSSSWNFWIVRSKSEWIFGQLILWRSVEKI